MPLFKELRDSWSRHLLPFIIWRFNTEKTGLGQLDQVIKSGLKVGLSMTAAIQNAYLKTLPGHQPGDHAGMDEQWMEDVATVTGLSYMEVEEAIYEQSYAFGYLQQPSLAMH